MRRARLTGFSGAFLVMAATCCDVPALAKDADSPTPIPAPPIPTPAHLTPPPPVVLPPVIQPTQPKLDIPAPSDLPPIAMPPQAQMTPADKTDPTPPPPSGLMTGPPAMVSPGAQATEKLVVPLEPGSTQMPDSVVSALRHVADVMRRDTEARVEVRSFTAARPRNEGNARRLALARYFAIREMLVGDGVASKRIDGRPLISASDELNADRIELYIELTPTRRSR